MQIFQLVLTFFLYIGSYYILCHAVQLRSIVFKTSPLSLIKYIWRTIWAFFQHHKTPENIIFINLIFLSRVYWIKDTRKCEWFKDLSLLKKKNWTIPAFKQASNWRKYFQYFSMALIIQETKAISSSWFYRPVASILYVSI